MLWKSSLPQSPKVTELNYWCPFWCPLWTPQLSKPCYTRSKEERRGSESGTDQIEYQYFTPTFRDESSSTRTYFHLLRLTFSSFLLEILLEMETDLCPSSISVVAFIAIRRIVKNK
jgi:hypothetical protein